MPGKLHWFSETPGGGHLRNVMYLSQEYMSMRKILNILNAGSKQQGTPEETAHGCLADTKCHHLLTCQFHQFHWLKQIYTDGSKIVFRVGLPADNRSPWCCSHRVFPILPFRHHHLHHRRPGWQKSITLIPWGKKKCCIMKWLKRICPKSIIT